MLLGAVLIEAYVVLLVECVGVKPAPKGVNQLLHSALSYMFALNLFLVLRQIDFGYGNGTS